MVCKFFWWDVIDIRNCHFQMTISHYKQYNAYSCTYFPENVLVGLNSKIMYSNSEEKQDIKLLNVLKKNSAVVVCSQHQAGMLRDLTIFGNKEPTILPPAKKTKKKSKW
jgi:hypothetical protein